MGAEQTKFVKELKALEDESSIDLSRRGLEELPSAIEKLDSCITLDLSRK